MKVFNCTVHIYRIGVCRHFVLDDGRAAPSREKLTASRIWGQFNYLVLNLKRLFSVLKMYRAIYLP